MKKVLYLGGFELPDKNAAAQRVLSISKALNDLKYKVKLCGITKVTDYYGTIGDLTYEAIKYPQGIYAWINYALGIGVIDYIKKEQPSIIVLYNYPAIAQARIINFSRKNKIKVIGDITEWYRHGSILKRFDTWLRMKVVNRQLNGIIVISKYLESFYNNQTTVLIPPCVDKKENKWNTVLQHYERDFIQLVYIGTGSIKDRLDLIVKSILKIPTLAMRLYVIGIDKNAFYKIYGHELLVNDDRIVFCGRLPHLDALVYLRNSDFQIFFRDNIRANNAGFPTKLVESFSAGVPVITNKVSNISDYITDGVNSFLLDEISEVEIDRALSQIASMSKEDIALLKKNIDSNQFDYRKITDLVDAFICSLE